MGGGSICQRVLSQIRTDHVKFDLDLVKIPAIVNADHAIDHPGEDDGISEMGLDRLGLLAGHTVFDALGDFVHQLFIPETIRSLLGARVTPRPQSPPDPGVVQLNLLQGCQAVNLVESLASEVSLLLSSSHSLLLFIHSPMCYRKICRIFGF